MLIFWMALLIVMIVLLESKFVPYMMFSNFGFCLQHAVVRVGVYFRFFGGDACIHSL